MAGAKSILINRLAPLMDKNKTAIPNVELYFNRMIPVSEARFKLLKLLEFMIIDEEEEDLFSYFGYPVQVSVYDFDADCIYCSLEDFSVDE
jgi:hypothetical protein